MSRLEAFQRVLKTATAETSMHPSPSVERGEEDSEETGCARAKAPKHSASSAPSVAEGAAAAGVAVPFLDDPDENDRDDGSWLSHRVKFVKRCVEIRFAAMRCRLFVFVWGR